MTINNIIILVAACLNAITAISQISIKIKIKLKLKSQLKKQKKAKEQLEKQLFNTWKKDYEKKWGKCE